jgi:Ca2+-binding RTX toxin-like protein
MSKIALVADDSTNTVTVFNQQTNTVLGSVSIPFGGAIGDVSILGDGSLGFVTNFNDQLFVIDLTEPTTPTIASTIPISNNGEDITITSDEKFLIVSDGSAVQPLSVIDLTSFTEVETFSSGSDFNSVEVTLDGSILTTSFRSDLVRKFSIDSNGNITNTGLTLAVPDPNNAYVSPDTNFGVAVSRSGSIISFNISDLSPVDTTSLSNGFGLAGVFAPNGETFYTLTQNTVEAYSFDPLTGDLGNTPTFTIGIDPQRTFFGMDQIDITPDGQKLYIGESNGVNVYSTLNGTLLDTINNSTLIRSTGVALQDFSVIKNVINGSPDDNTLVGTQDNDRINGFSGNDIIAGGLGNDEIFGGDGDDVLRGDLNQRSPQVGIGGDDIIFGGAGNDRIGGKGGNDQIFGEEGDDQIWGDDGDDILRGGLGNDTLTGDDFSGGSGSDVFVLAVNEGTDTIVDFQDGKDLIGLADGLSFGQLSITQDGNNTLIGFEQETLAILQKVNANLLTEVDFTSIG